MADLALRVLAGETRAAARLCRLLDDREPGHEALLRTLYDARVSARRIGVTGSPGAGKSTLVAALVSALRARGGRVGVVAVDPSSPFTGGAILGDRIRMQRHFEDPDVFIRSLATRGALGGLSRSARDVVRVLEAWGAGTVIIETVGVGQDEIDVTRVAETTVVVVAPGGGDDIQAIKAGILECADVLVVNKADRPGADATLRDLENMLAVGALSRASVVRAPTSHAGAGLVLPTGEAEAGFSPRVLRTVATRDEGIDLLVGELDRHAAHLATPAGQAERALRTEQMLVAWLRDRIADEVSAAMGDALRRSSAEVALGTLDPHTAVDRLVQAFRGV